MKRIAIIGGGIAGLSAACYLEKKRRGGVALQWTLFEKSDRLGGVIRTEQQDGFVLEAGPDSFLTVKPDAAQLCRELGLGDQLISSNDFQRRTYIVVNGRLVPIPDGLEFMVPTRVLPMITTPLFSVGTKIRMAREWLAPKRKDDRDESVADFVRRHFGQQMVERVAEPLLAGVYGGDAEQLSVRAVLPRFVEMERESGSLVQATLEARRKRKASPGGAPQPLFTSLNSGMQQMVEAIVTQLPMSAINLHQQVTSLSPRGSGWQVHLQNSNQEFDEVLLAQPAVAAAAVLSDAQPELAALLSKTPYTSSAAVLLAYDHALLPPGFGFLIPMAEGRRMLACTFVHRKFPHRAPEGKALLRCFFSSARVPHLLQYSDEGLLHITRTELQELLGLATEPKFSRVFRWSRGLPQYGVGHPGRVQRAEEILGQLTGLQIIGNSFYGIGVPDCIRSARQAVEKIV